MIHRPVDDSGDILPVLVSSSLFRDVRAEAQLTRDRLALLAGDWWENPAWGNEALEMLKASRLTEADMQSMASYISSYIRETPGVLDVRDVIFSVEGRQFRYHCTVITESGETAAGYEVNV